MAVQQGPSITIKKLVVLFLLVESVSSACDPNDLLQSTSGPECPVSVNDCTICSDDGIVCAVYNGTSESSIAVYNSTTDYCLNNGTVRTCDGDDWSGAEPDVEEVTEEMDLETSDIIFIAIGVTGYIVGMCIASVLGPLLLVRAKYRGDIVLAVIVMIASTLLFPVAAVLYFVIKKKKQEESERPFQLALWYRYMTMVTAILSICAFILWLAVIGYTFSHDFDDEGYRRGDNSACESTDGNRRQIGTRRGLIFAAFMVSMQTGVDWLIRIGLWRYGSCPGKGGCCGRSCGKCGSGKCGSGKCGAKTEKRESDNLKTDDGLKLADYTPLSPEGAT